MEEFLQKLGKRIALKRKRKKMSQEALAELTDMHRTYIGAIEQGKYNVTINNLKRIADALNCSLENLFKNF